MVKGVQQTLAIAASGSSDYDAVVVGLCGHGLAVARALHRIGARVAGVECNRALPGTRTTVATVLWVQDINSDALIDCLVQLRAAPNGTSKKPALFLTNDNMVEVVSRHAELLAPHYVLSWAPNAETVRRLLKKDAIEAQCRVAGLSYPKSLLVHDLAELDLVQQRLDFPVIFKPVQPISAFKTIVVSSMAEARSQTDRLAQCLPLLAQEYVQGDDSQIFFGAAVFDNGKPLCRFEGQKLRSRPMGHTTVAIGRSSDEVHALTMQFFAGLGMNGPASLEVKRDTVGRYWVIEPTVGRSDFWVDLCTQNKVNLPAVEYALVTGTTWAPSKQADNIVWINGQRDPLGYFWTLLHHPAVALRMRPRGLFIDAHDLRPALRLARQQLADFLTRLLRKVQPAVGRDAARPENSSAPPKAPVLAIRDVEVHPLNAPLPPEVVEFFAQHAPRSMEAQLYWSHLLQANVPGLRDTARLLMLRGDGGFRAAWPVQIGAAAGSLSNYFTALYQPIHVPGTTATELRALVEELRRLSPNSHEFRFEPMDPDCEGFELMQRSLDGAGLRTFRYFRFGNWYLPAADLRWSSYLDSRASRLRSTIQRKGNRFQRDGGRLEIVSGGDRLECALQAFESVYRASWKKVEPLRGFVSELARHAASIGALRLGIAWLSDTPIAAQIWFVTFDHAAVFKLAHDDTFNRYSPGTVLTAAIVKHVLDVDRVHEIDYLIGDDPHKAAWMTHRRERWGLVAYDVSHPRGLLSALLQRRSERLHKRLPAT